MNAEKSKIFHFIIILSRIFLTEKACTEQSRREYNAMNVNIIFFAFLCAFSAGQTY